jgi:O-Antigen ligase
MTSHALVDPLPDSSATPVPNPAPARSTIWSDRIAAAGLAALGGALGASQLVQGVYNETAWAPIALGALGLVVALAVAGPRLPPMALLAPVLGLWLWSLLSAGWGDSTDAARIAADRWLLYAAAIVVLAWALARDRRRAVVLLTSASAGVLVVAAWMLARMLDGNGQSLFLATRLNDPLGYVNGQAAYLLVAAWPCLALAEHRGSRASGAIAGIGMASLVALLGLGLLCQSRSWEVALAAAVVVLEAAIPGRRRRAAALLLAGATMAAIYMPVAGVWRHPNPVTGLVTAGAARHAAVAILVAALAAGLVWAVVVLSLHRLAPAGSPARGRVRSLASAALVALGVAAAVAIGVNAGAIEKRVHSQYEAFVQLSPGSGGSRLVSGAGNRYDYWRVALIEFRSAPVGGVGAGNYDTGYYLRRRTTEAITQPHSLELQTLAELGVVGGALLAAFLVAVGLGFRRAARSARHDLLARRVAVAAGGTFTVWLVQTSVDWTYLIPGVTAIALAAAVALVSGPESRSVALAGRMRIATIVAAAAVAIAGTVTIAPRILSLRAQASAQRALDRGDPRAAVSAATTALEYDPESVPAFVLQSAGFAALHSFTSSLSDLERAVAVEPRNWVTWALVGDLLTRRGDVSGARTAYAHALALDPLEPELKSALPASATVTVR